MRSSQPVEARTRLLHHISISVSPLAPNPTKIQYKINTLCYKCITGTAASYLCDCLQLYTRFPTLRSASDTLSLQIPRTRLSTVGFRAFSVFGQSTWNDLPLPLRQKFYPGSFKCNLKTFPPQNVDLPCFLFRATVFVCFKSLFAAPFKLRKLSLV